MYAILLLITDNQLTSSYVVVIYELYAWRWNKIGAIKLVKP